MTTEQIVEALATEVMGWEKPEGFCSKQGWGKNTRWWDAQKKGYVDPFDPLHDHNHMALVRKKMRDSGWKFNRDDLFDRNNTLFDEPYEVALCYNGYYICHATAKDELMAEALSVLEAIKCK